MLSTPPRIPIPSGSIDLPARRIRRDGGEEHLTDLEAGLLAFLVARPGQAVPVDVLLREVWGHTRTVETRAVHNTVRRLRAKIEINPAEPVHLRTVFGVGFSWEPAAQPVESAPIHRPPPPHFTDLFVGRSAELTSLTRAVASGVRLLSLVGVGGIGKTRLGLAWLRTLPPSTTIGLCALDAATTGAAVRAAVSRWVGCPPSNDDVAIGAALKGLGPAALLLDDVGSTADIAASLSCWLGLAPELVLLTTCRVRPPLRGAFVLHVPPLPCNEPVDAPGGAGALFLDRARAAGASLQPDRATVNAVRAVLAHVGGVPSALEALAFGLAGVPLPALVATLGEWRAPAGAPDAALGVGMPMCWSWGALSAVDRQHARSLSYFAGGFSVSAAGRVLGLPADATVTLLNRLVGASVLLPPDPQTGRYGVLPLLHRALREERAVDPAEDPVEQRLLAWASGLDPEPLDPYPPIAVVQARRQELHTLAEVVDLALVRREFEMAARIGLTLARGYELVGPRAADLALMERLLLVADRVHPLTAAALRLRRFSLLPILGGPGGGAALDELAASLPEDAHVHWTLVSFMRSATHLAHGRHDEARAQADELTRHADASGVPGLRLRARATRTRIRAVTGDRSAIAAGVEAAYAAQTQGLLSAEADLELATCRACHVLGRPAEALVHVTRALACIDRLEEAIGMPLPLLRLVGLGERLAVVHWQGDVAETQVVARALAPLAADLGEQTVLSESEQLLAWAAIVGGDAAAAAHHALAARGAVDAQGRPRLWWAAQVWLGVARLLLGDVPGAIEVLEPAVRRWVELGEGIGDVAAAWLAVACASADQPSAAAAWLDQMDAIPAGREGVPADERAAARRAVQLFAAGATLDTILPTKGSFRAMVTALEAR